MSAIDEVKSVLLARQPTHTAGSASDRPTMGKVINAGLGGPPPGAAVVKGSGIGVAALGLGAPMGKGVGNMGKSSTLGMGIGIGAGIGIGSGLGVAKPKAKTEAQKMLGGLGMGTATVGPKKSVSSGLSAPVSVVASKPRSDQGPQDSATNVATRLVRSWCM